MGWRAGDGLRERQTEGASPASAGPGPQPAASSAPSPQAQALLRGQTGPFEGAAPIENRPLPQGSPGPGLKPPAAGRSPAAAPAHLSVQLPQRRHHQLLELRDARPGPPVGQLPAGKQSRGQSGGAPRRRGRPQGGGSRTRTHRRTRR